MSMNRALGQYILGERLAAGGMAEIFHASCLTPGRFDRPIVLKRMHKHLAENRDFVSMFVDEARISTRLDHPNIVQLFDFQANSDGLYIILEYIEGPDLLSLLKGAARRRTMMPPEIAVYITCHMLEALDYAHSMEINGRPMGVVHRDVSPGNVLISKHGRVKLADFGIARANDRQKETETGTLKGKYGYMSPEQIEAKHLDGRSDIFSAAIVLAELLMSKRLFRATNQLDVLLMVRSGDLGRLEANGQHIDAKLMAIIRKALARDRDERFSTAGEFRDALAEWLAAGKLRMSTSILKSYIRELTSEGFVKPASQGDGTGSLTMSGTNTRALSLAARGAAAIGREMFDVGTMSSIDLTLGAAGVTVITSRPEVLKEIDDEYEDVTIETPLEAGEALDCGHGELGFLLPLDLIGAIAADDRTGLLTLERDEVNKQAYFVDGHPIFVASNEPRERFGQFLVRRELITAEQLDRAIATMPHFGGKLGQALVGLHLLKPVDAVHLLAEQVSEKLLRSCDWDHGRYVWQEGQENPHDTVALHLSSHRIVARGVQQIPAKRLEEWIYMRRDSKPNLAQYAPYDAYGLGPSLTKRIASLNGQRTLGSLIDSASKKSARVISAAAYAIIATQKP